VTHLIHLLAHLNEATGRWATRLAAVLLAAMTLLVLGQIAGRATTGVTFAWIEEAARILLVWSAFLIAPYAYRMGGHVSIDLFQSSLPLKLRTALMIVLHVLVIWVSGVFLLESISFWQRGLDITAATMPVKMAWFYAIVPLSFASLILVGVELFLRLVASWRYPQQDWRVPGSQPLIPVE
jgi:TRAP-type transport system small permease protein